MDFLAEATEKKSANLRQDEITGEQHLFHSLPKEFQTWHNTQFMLEKKMDVDASMVPDALLNAYMWKAIYDGSKFAIPTVMAIIFAVIKLKLSPNLWGFLISMSIFIPWLAYVTMHFLFYAKIKAQVVGPVTRKCAKYTVDTFESTFYGIVFSLIAAFLVFYSFIEDIAVLLKKIILSMNTENDMAASFFQQALTYVYNFLVDILHTNPHTLYEKVLSNVYVTVTVLTVLTLASIYFFEREVYQERKKAVEEEIREEELNSGYLAEAAMKTLHDSGH